MNKEGKLKMEWEERVKNLGEKHYISKNLRLTDEFSRKYNIPMEELIDFVETLNKNLNES